MVWFLIGHIFSTLISVIRVSHLSEDDKDLEIIILRHQLDVMVRKQTKPVKPNRAEKVTLAQLTAKLKHSSNRSIRQLGDVIRIVRPNGHPLASRAGAAQLDPGTNHIPNQHIKNYFVPESLTIEPRLIIVQHDSP